MDEGGYGITHVGVDHCRLVPALKDRVPNAYIEYREKWQEFAKERGLPVSARENTYIQDNLLPSIEYIDGKPAIKMQAPPRFRMPFPGNAEDFLDFFWARHAAEKIAELDTSKPQYIETLFWAPHPPYVVPEPYYSMYPTDSINMPETVGKWGEGKPASLFLQACGSYGMTTTREEYRSVRSVYYGFATMVDECIGRVIQALKDRGIWENAFVIFTQDHGDMLGEHFLMQKMCAYEPASHLPLLIKPPEGYIGDFTRRPHLISHVDFADTICEITGCKPLPGSQGRSYLPVLKDSTDTIVSWPKNLFMEYNGDQGRGAYWRAIISDTKEGRFKYIYTEDDIDELYDITADPLEKHSIVGEPPYATLRADLRNRLFRWMVDTGDFLKPPDSD